MVAFVTPLLARRGAGVSPAKAAVAIPEGAKAAVAIP